jgi:hypothetical protein
MEMSAKDERSEQVARIAQQLAEQGYPDVQQTEDQWAFLIDPAYRPENPDDGVPVAAIVGGWLASVDGTLSKFHPNPDYVPSQPGSPTDPVDATLQLAHRGEATAESLFSVIKVSNFGVALDENDEPIIARSPDDVMSLLVTTAPLHRERVIADKWRDVDAAELAGLVAEHKVDLLLNPGAPTSMRLIGDMFTENVLSD